MSCPPDSWPSLQTNYDAQGTIHEIDGLQIYTSGDASSGKGIIMMTDVWGWESGRHKAVADHLAMEGYFVVLPDLFRGVELQGLSEIVEWGSKFPYEGVLQSEMRNIIFPFLEKSGISSIGTIGFCWGCWCSFNVCGDEVLGPLVKASVNCHPSLGIEEKVFNADPLNLARRLVSTPQLLLTAENDPDYVKPSGGVPEILNEKGIDCQMHVFDEQKHGWVVRGDLQVTETARDVRLALEKALEFFASNL
eukprot:TRINITY_DN3996_c0_g2_i1.p1 TRINITY_DN3996_c0_g2~~TRINITY_DN3996_c0_g2_i1.p1  ORF type:complete len:249 (-),score=58.29 TRINITY_DN3996_c0_g2_i1:25-771(-)